VSGQSEKRKADHATKNHKKKPLSVPPRERKRGDRIPDRFRQVEGGEKKKTDEQEKKDAPPPERSKKPSLQNPTIGRKRALRILSKFKKMIKKEARTHCSWDQAN